MKCGRPFIGSFPFICAEFFNIQRMNWMNFKYYTKLSRIVENSSITEVTGGSMIG